jgi:hypothetical protein
MSKLIPALLLSCFLAACNSHEASIDKEAVSLELNSLMDNWHQAAAVANEDVFFGSMHDDAIYLGTDKSERWEKNVFEEWSSKYFERDTAWAFSPYDRELYFAEDGKTVWFEELLETWMGPCRGSGVITLKENQWRIAHYNLAMLIDNDDVQDVINLITDKDQQPPVLPDSQ